jgi:hypothetical protein
MGFMDKAKQAAMQAKESAQHVAQQGQAKVASVQESRNVGELYKTLGEAVYNAQRHGGDQDAVNAALAALDQHFAQAAAAPAAPAAPATPDAVPPPVTPTEGVTPPPPAAPAAPPAGDFTLDDV